MPPADSPEELARSHRWHAIECNNLAWELSELAERTAAQNEEMLHAAHAAAFHWAKVGNDLNRARANSLLGRVHAALNDGPNALRFARESYDYLIAHDPSDWERAFAHAILADAARAAGDTPLHRQHYAEAKKLGEAIAEPDEKEIFWKTFRLIPEP